MHISDHTCQQAPDAALRCNVPRAAQSAPPGRLTALAPQPQAEAPQ